MQWADTFAAMLKKLNTTAADIRLFHLCLLLFLVLTALPCVHAQTMSSNALVVGRVVDAASNLPIQGVTLSRRSGARISSSEADGSFHWVTEPGTHTIVFSAPGYQGLQIDRIPASNGMTTFLPVYLKQAKVRNDTLSSNATGSLTVQPYDRYVRSAGIAVPFGLLTDMSVRPDRIDGALSQSVAAGLRFIPSMNTPSVGFRNQPNSIMVNGMEGRYVNVFVNGSAVPIYSNHFATQDLLNAPAEIVDRLSLETGREASTPGEFGMAKVNITFKSRPVKNFIYLQVGSEFQNAYAGNRFYGDRKTFREWAALPGATRELPAGFPGAKSDSRLFQKNPQERYDLLKTLPNALSTEDIGNLQPGSRMVFGIGRKYILKQKQEVGWMAFVSHDNQFSIAKTSVMTAPNVGVNPYPFSNANERVIRSFADQTVFAQHSQLNALLTGGISWNKSKIDLNISYTGVNYLSNTQSTAMFKPDEDSLAGSAISYRTRQARNIMFSVMGNHAFGKTGHFHFDWVVNYNNYRQHEPDKRFFLLRQDSLRNDFFEIARPQTMPLADRTSVSRPVLNANLDAIFTNSSRGWEYLTDHFFTGAAGLSTPLTLFHLQHHLKGGITLQAQYQELYSDLFLYSGQGYFPVNGLIAPERYFPGGLNAEEYYVPLIGQTGSFNPLDVNADNFGNYLGSINVGAGFISNETKLSERLAVKLGLRFETASQLVSLFEYHYFEGFKNPEKITLDENVNVSTFDLLPSASINFTLHPKILTHASYYRSLNRPRMNELTEYRRYDAENFMAIGGNRLLEATAIDNMQASIDFRPFDGSLIGLRGAYKKIYRPIEYLLTGFAAASGNQKLTPYNMPVASVRSIQLSVSTALSARPARWLSKVSVWGNVTLLNSSVKAGPIKSVDNPSVEEHSLTGTPDYAMNVGVLWQAPRYPALRLEYEQTGDYLVAVGSGSPRVLVNGFTVLSRPHYYAKGRKLMNVQVSQKMLRARLILMAGVNNLFAEDIIQYQDLNGNRSYDEPLSIGKTGPNRGFTTGGIDNSTRHVEGLRSFFIRLTYQL